MDEFLYKKVIDLIYHSISSEGGDGDAIWLSRFESLDKIEELIKVYAIENNIKWNLQRDDEHTISWGQGQEWGIITDDEVLFNNSPEWSVLKIRY